MGRLSPAALAAAFPVCRSFAEPAAWIRVAAACDPAAAEGALAEALRLVGGSLGLPPFLPDLAWLERLVRDVRDDPGGVPAAVALPRLNPTLRLVERGWRRLSPLLDSKPAAPSRGSCVFLAWRRGDSREVRVREATDADLLALKVTAEGMDPREAAGVAGPQIDVVASALRHAAAEELILVPASRLIRDPEVFPEDPAVPERFRVAETFTLQWHVTQACDLRCAHCYDRSERAELETGDGIRVLDDLYDFCRERHVRGQVTFSGGNPLLRPDFLELHRAARDRGFPVGILGNPAPRGRVEEVLGAGSLEFFQVSLEGLPEHNDAVRGAGHFSRTLAFLDVLRDLGVYSMVMLTLTRDNLDQVLPLAELLRGRVDGFHFNRLSPVGEAAKLLLPDGDSYARFLGRYLEERERSPFLGLKDNHFNPLLRQRDRDLFGGCTGHGCGAAFNFVSLLADGEVHACRKFPSLLGRLPGATLGEIYDAPAARRYRNGCSACTGCRLRAVCGGCLAVAEGVGRDPFLARDPFCTFAEAPDARG